MKYLNQVIKAIDYIENNLMEDISVSDVARVSGISSWHFQRLFHESIGETIGAYLRRRRLAHSLDLLKDGKKKVIDIAFDLQFESPESFSRSFKNEFSISPLQYLKSAIVVLPYKRPKLTSQEVTYLVKDLNLEAEMKFLEAFQVVGLKESFVSPLSKRHEYMAQMPLLWREFNQREEELGFEKSFIKYGIILNMASTAHHIHDDRLDYLAGVPHSGHVDEKSIPIGFESLMIPGGLYAVFKSVGYHEQTQFLIDYVYSCWLIKSDYQRGEGPEFTYVNHSEYPLNPQTTIVYYYLPVISKKL